MNIHHLELFYYVAKYGGISEAVRKMPYGIQQPAVSAQVLQLESHLGVSLFSRRPFCLSPPGDKLYRFIQPFFDNLENIAEEIKGEISRTIRIGASDVVLKDHVPALIQRLREKFPATKLTLRSGYQPELLEWLRKQELDLALTLVDRNLSMPLQVMPVLKLPLVLLCNKKLKVQSASELWARKSIDIPLLCLPPEEVLCKLFQDGLRTRRVEWMTSIELNSLELIADYVESGYGIGLGVAVPGRRFSKKIKALPLPDFPYVEFGAIWQGQPTPLMQALLHEVKLRAEEVAAEFKDRDGSVEAEDTERAEKRR